MFPGINGHLHLVYNDYQPSLVSFAQDKGCVRYGINFLFSVMDIFVATPIPVLVVFVFVSGGGIISIFVTLQVATFNAPPPPPTARSCEINRHSLGGFICVLRFSIDLFRLFSPLIWG